MFTFVIVCVCVCVCVCVDDSDGSDTAPFLDDIHIRRPVHPHPFIKLLKELWPFGEEFRSLKWTEKIYEVIKVQDLYMCMH